MYVREVVENCQKKRHRYNLLLFQSNSNSGAYMLLEKLILIIHYNIGISLRLQIKCTQWVEAIPFSQVNEDEVINFLQKNIWTRFGVLFSPVFDNASYFSSVKITEFSYENGIKLHY